MDVVIPLSAGSYHNNLELIYCLRAIEKHLTNCGNVFIVGEDPHLQNVIHIPAKDEPGLQNKEKNIFNKILIACNDARASETFYCFHDDHFLLKDFDGTYYHAGKFKNIDRLNPDYAHSVRNTINYLGHVDNYDTHMPIVFDKQKFLSLPQEPFTKNFGIIVKTLYCVKNNITGEFMNDCNIRDGLTEQQIYKRIAGRWVFAVGNGGLTSIMQKVLLELYPTKSKYEV